MCGMAALLGNLGVDNIRFVQANVGNEAAASTKLILVCILTVLLALPLLAIASPPVSLWGIHPITPVITAAYLFGLHLVRKTDSKPMWFPRLTRQTVPDKPGHYLRGGLAQAWVTFIILAAITGVAGWILMEGAKVISDETGLSDTLIGGLFTALATSSPELVTTIAAIRRNALTLAVSNIFGTNCFNMLVIASADVGYPGGSIYHDITPIQMTWGLVSILMTATLLMGMVRRQRYGIGKIGFESALMLSVYAMALIIVTVSG